MPSARYHNRLDLSDLIRKHPLAACIAAERADHVSRGREFRDDWLPLRHIFHEPSQLALFEQTRLELARRGEELGFGLPYDAVFWTRDPSTGPVSRLGGIPFRAASRPWPRTGDGTPAVFVAQFCLADSLDVIRPTPRRDIILLFARTCNVKNNTVDAYDFFLEWSSSKNVGTMGPSDVPSGGVLPFCYTGVLCRTADHPLLEPMSIPERQRWRLESTQSSRIGGYPHWIQEPPSDRRLLVTCALSYYKPTAAHAVSAGSGHDEPDFHLNLVDAGCVYVTTDPLLRWRYKVAEQSH